MQLRRRRFLLAVGTTASAGLAGCGDAGSDDGLAQEGDGGEGGGDGGGDGSGDGGGGTTTRTDGGEDSPTPGGTDAVTEECYSCPVDSLQVSIEVAYDADERTLEVLHNSGESITHENSAELFVRIDGERRATWYGGSTDEELVVGESLTVEEVSPEATVAVVRMTPSGETDILWGPSSVPA